MDFFHYTFIQHALIAAFLVSIACGVVGTYIVIQRLVFISGGISHAAFGGVGLGYLLGINPILAAIPFSIASAIGIGLISRDRRISPDTAIGVLWTMGMALGILFIGLKPGYAPDLHSYLFGNILTVPAYDLWIMAALNAVILLVVALFHREFYSLAFDDEFATVVGVPTRACRLLLLCLIALSVVILIRVVGIILVMALLTMPSAICRPFTHDLKKLILSSAATGLLLTIAGLWISYVFDLPSGATIVLVLGAAFFLSLMFRRK
jgi:zinc transport system permease protein